MRRGGVYSGGSARSRGAVPASRPAPRPAIFGIGVDVVHVSRVAKVHARHGARFAQRMLHPLELARLPQVREPANFLAKCFAVKEAFVKAFGTGFIGIAHGEVGWTRATHQRPQLCLSPRLAKLVASRGVGAMHLALSDEVDLVCAMVTLERA